MEDFKLNFTDALLGKAKHILLISAFKTNLFMESAQAFASLVGIIYFNVKSLAAGTYKSIIQPVQQHIQQGNKD